MGPLLARKKRISQVVEFLEGRQLLSQFGPAAGWDPHAQEAAARPDLQPAPIWGSMVATDGRADRPMASSGSPDGFPPAQGRDGPSVATGPASDCANPWTAEGPGPAGSFPSGGGFSGPALLVIMPRSGMMERD